MIRRLSTIHRLRRGRIRRTKLINAVYHTDIKRYLLSSGKLTVLMRSVTQDV